MSTHSASVSHRYQAPEAGGWSRIARALAAVGEILASIPRAAQAAALYQDLSSRSDEALAERGLKREDLPHYVFNTVLEPRG